MKFSGTGEFKIMQLTDLHFCGDPNKDAKVKNVMETLLDAEPNIDLVVLSGDILSGDGWDPHNQTPIPEVWKLAVSPMQERRIPYAVVLGNHDGKGYLSNEELISLDMQQAYSLSRQIKGVPASNYYLTVHSVNSTTLLWFLDSGSFNCRGRNEWGCVEEQVLNWALQIKEPFNASVAFIHIPLVQVKSRYLRNRVGDKLEKPCSPSYDYGMMEFAKRQRVKAFFHGHDRFYGDVFLAYGIKTGYNGYMIKNKQSGARVIVLDVSKPYPDTWLRVSFHRFLLRVWAAEYEKKLDDGTMLRQKYIKEQWFETITYEEAFEIILGVCIMVVAIIATGEIYGRYLLPSLRIRKQVKAT